MCPFNQSFVVFQHARQKAGGKQQLRAALIIFPRLFRSHTQAPIIKNLSQLSRHIHFYLLIRLYIVIEPAPVANKFLD